MTELDQLMAIMDDAFDPHWREAWTRAQVEDSLRFPSTHYILASALNTQSDAALPVSGFVLARRILDEEELLLLAVRKDARRQGLGANLLRQFIDAARDNGVKRVFLEMRDRNPAERLYRKFGFEQIGRRRDYYRTASGDRIDALTFARSV